MGTVTDMMLHRSAVASVMNTCPLNPLAYSREADQVIHMGMGQEHEINLCLIHRKGNILKDVHPLFHPVIHQHMPAARLQIMTASCYLMIRTNKYKLHNPYLLFNCRKRHFVPHPSRRYPDVVPNAFTSMRLRFHRNDSTYLFFDQLVVVPLLHDPLLRQHQDTVGVPDAGKPVGYGQVVLPRTALLGSGHGKLALVIQGGSGLVQDDDGRIL